MKISFHKPYFDEREVEAVAQVVRSGHVVGGGPFMKRVEAGLRKRFAVKHFLAMTSGTHALELAMMTLRIGPGDEVIVPAYTFASTATAVVRQRAKVVFCDVRTDDLNMSVEDMAARINSRTKAVIPVHYAGLPCRMEEILAIANKRGIAVVEDAAQAVDSFYKGRALGTWGDLGCYSFHGSKSVGCGEGGALATHSDDLAHRAEILREKGTDRAQFLRGEIDKYTWRDEGSSFIPPELSMAVMAAQVEKMDEILRKRGALFWRYRQGLADLEKRGVLAMPPISADTKPNFHIFYVLLRDEKTRERVFGELRQREIEAARHYYPLDSSPYGQTFRPKGQADLPGAKEVTERLLRLPFYTAMPESQVDTVLEAMHEILK